MNKEDFKQRWLEQAKKRSIEKFGYNIIGVDEDLIENCIRY